MSPIMMKPRPIACVILINSTTKDIFVFEMNNHQNGNTFLVRLGTSIQEHYGILVKLFGSLQDKIKSLWHFC